MSNEVILNLSFDNQTVTDLTGNWTLDGTPNATYEQIDGRDGYSIVTGSLGRCIVLNAVDQNAVYNEYTVDFDMFVKSTYTSNYYSYYIKYLWSRINLHNGYIGHIGNVLEIFLTIGGSDRIGTTNYSPIGRWVHVTFTSGPTGVDDQYFATVYVDGVKLIERTDTQADYSPFALSQQIIPIARDTDAKLMPNGPGICLNTFKVVTGIHIPDQNPAISLFNLRRVFNNFCTWLKGQLSTVALTGSYNDLSDKPTISTVNDGTLTIQQNGTTVNSFSANSNTNKTANIQCVDLNTAQTISGVKTFTSNMVIQGSKKVTCTLDNSFIELDGGTTWGKGGSIVLSGQDRSSYTNSVLIVSKSETNTDILQYQNGELKPLSNNTNNSSLGTSTNKWSKVYSDDVVHTTGNETIGGVKTFSDGLFASKSGQGDLATLEDSSINSTNEDANGMPLTGHTNSVKIKGSQFNVVPCMLTGQLYTSGDTSAELRAYKYKDLTTNAVIALRYIYANDTGFVQLKNISSVIPSVTSTANLGSASLQWNTTYTRNILVDNDINIASSLINKTSNSGMLSICSGLTTTDGASIGLYGKDYGGSSGLVGNVYLTAYSNSDYTNFRIYPNGIIRVYNNSTATTKNVAMQEDVVPRSGGAVLNGTLFTRADTNSNLTVRSGPYYADGASLQLKAKDQADASGGRLYLNAHNGTRNTTLVLWPTGEVLFDNALALKTSADNTCSCGTSDRRWTEVYSATGTINTSDVRLKNNIKDIDDKLLNAWGNIEPKQYKFNDATEKKGEKARFHTGYLAQDIQAECEKQGVNASDYGLFCYNEWEEQEEESEEIETEKDGKIIKEKRIIQPKREKGNMYALRYEEALVVECKYLRRCIARLTARIEELEKGC